MGSSHGGSGGSKSPSTAQGLGWGEGDLRKAYHMLVRQSPSFRDLKDDVSEDVWIKFNQLADRAMSDSEIAAELPVDLDTVLALRNPRRCIDLYDHDEVKVRKCLDGELP